MRETSDLSIVIVTYNSAQTIVSCLKNITQDLPPRCRVVVWDNASSDGTIDVVSSHFPNVETFTSSANLGFSAAVNRSVGHFALEGDLLLLNPDAYFVGSDLSELRAALIRDPRLAAVSPVVGDENGEMRVMHGGRFPRLLDIFTHYTGLARYLQAVGIDTGHYLYATTRRHRVHVVEWIAGTCLLVRRADWDRVRGLDETWFLYAEDIAFCHSLSQLSRRVAFVDACFALHAVGHSSRTSSQPNAAWIVNLFKFYQRDLAANRVSVHLWRATVCVGLAVRSGILALMGRRQRAREFIFYSRAVAAVPTIIEPR